jgi:hypothetical protein
MAFVTGVTAPSKYTDSNSCSHNARGRVSLARRIMLAKSD